MKRKSVIKRQTVRKRRKKRPSAFWRLISFLGGCFTKFSLLIIGLALISAVLITAYEYLLTSSYIRLEKVLITGIEDDFKRVLLENSGLSRGMSLFAVDTEEVRQRMEAHPWVRRVTLEKRLPHTLAVKVEREEARALVLLDRLYYINRWGEVFKAVDEEEDTDLPVITGVPGSEETRDRVLRNAVRVIGFLESEQGQWSLRELAEVHMEMDGNVSLYFNSLPASVEMNHADMGFRMADLKRVVEHLDSKGSLPMVKRIDLNYPDGAVVSFKKG